MHFAVLVQSFRLSRPSSRAKFCMAKKTKLTEKTPAELTKLLKEKREELRGLRFSAAGARPKDSNAPVKVRRDVARLLTEMGNRAKKA